MRLIDWCRLALASALLGLGVTACVPSSQPYGTPMPPSAPEPVPFTSPLLRPTQEGQPATQDVPFLTLAVNSIRDPLPPYIEPDLARASYLPDLSAQEWISRPVGSYGASAPAAYLIQASDEITKVDARLLARDARDALAGVNYAEDVVIVYLAGVMNGSMDGFIQRIASPPSNTDGQWGNMLFVDAVVRTWNRGPANVVYPYQVVRIPRWIIPIPIVSYTQIMLNLDYAGMDSP